MSHSAIEELALFVDEAKRLTTRSFYQHFIAEEAICFSDDPSIENVPTVEQLESYLLHFRKFVQKNDRVCIHTVNQYFHELAADQDVLLGSWKGLYATFQEFSEAGALTGRIITHDASIPDLTLLDIFKIRTFGDLSHLDSRKQKLHQQLSVQQLEGIYRFEYYNFLFEAGEIIVDMANLCKELIQQSI